MTENQFEGDFGGRLKWYLDAKFGLFIHWGAYSVAGAEASWPIMAPDLSEAMFRTPSTISEKEYLDLPQRFNPVEFNADEWVSVASEAGAKYIVITAKHHDGFCMFDAPGTEYKITNTPFGRDVCSELAAACKRAGMRLGFYYSPPDMHHPGYRDTSKPSVKNWLGEPDREEWTLYLDYMESHIRKLLTDYGKVSIIWFDGLCNHAKYDPERFHGLIHGISPDTLINDRLGDGYDFITPEQLIPKDGIPVKTDKPPSGNGIESEKFFRTVTTLFRIPVARGLIRKQIQRYSEGKLDLSPQPMADYPSPEEYQPWETCMTMGTTWAYNPNETQWKQPQELVRNLSKVIGHGGNYLLNVGPSDKGRFPEEAADRLGYIGKWIDANSDSVYGTRYTRYNSMEWGSVVRRDSKLFMHIQSLPGEGVLKLNGFDGRIRSVHSSGSGKPEYTVNKEGLEIRIPETEIKDVLVVTLETEDGTDALYSKAKPAGKSLKEYVMSNAIWSAAINGIANGLIAFFTYRRIHAVPSWDAAFDILITVAIISFLTCWLVTGGARKDIKNGNLAVNGENNHKEKRLISPILKGLLLMVLCTVVFGGPMFALTLFVFRSGFSGWGYILYKTIYTAAAGVVSVYITIKSVIREFVQKLPTGDKP